MVLSLESVRAYYPANDAVHGFDHIQRVLALAKIIAERENADWEIVQAAVLLHDARLPAANPPTPEKGISQRNHHHENSARLAAAILRRAGWDSQRIKAVSHCIRSHRYRCATEKPVSLEAKILFDADKLDAIGAVGAARAIAFAVQHDESFYTPPSSQFSATGILEEGERYSAYHEYIYKLKELQKRLFTRSAQQIAQARQEFLIQFFERLKQECELNDFHL